MNATTKGVINLLDYYKVNLVGQHALVIGRSMLVGKSIALALLNRDATVTIAHTKTVNIKQLAQRKRYFDCGCRPAAIYK